jgi:hypothetical protein
MKTHTQQQTNLEIETTATEQKLSSRKRSKYRPRKWRGNTLVPVIIALFISAIATVAFLNQGANLAADNKIVIAQNEIVAIHGEYTLAAFRKGATNVANTDLPFIYGSSAYRSNIFGKAYSFTAATATTTTSQGTTQQGTPATVTYGTDNNTTCNELATIVNRLGGLTGVCATGTGTMTITLN